MILRTEVRFGRMEEVLASLRLEGRGLLCCRRRFEGRMGGELVPLRISPEPSLEEVEGYWEGIRGEDFQYVLAVGGGSVLDVAKVLAALMENPGKVRDFFGVEKIPRRMRRFIAIPTTHGTGSEVTKYSVIRVGEEKWSIVSENICPHVAILDEGLMRGLPRDLTLSTSMDALCHLVEAYLTPFCDPMVDLLCEQGIRLFLEGLEGAVEDDPEGRRKMMLCSLLGGVAITNAQASLVHALSHVLGGKYRVPHGEANSLFLPAFLRFYAGEKKLEGLERWLGVRLAEEVERIREKYGMKRLSDFVGEREAVEVAERAYRNRRLVEGNLKKVGPEDLKEIALRSL
ncbi:MAG: iron-containing alcohol dehydrogenase [Candidatus Hadarchaeales archaeon]